MKPIYPQPNYLSSIWAGSRLSEIRGLTPEPGKPIGIAREVCAYKNAENLVEKGEYAGMKLSDLIASHHDALLGDDPASQLVRAAYMDAVDDLSIQVHPGEAYAAARGDYEKSESWYVLACKEGASITAGVTITDKAELRRAAENGTLERYVRRIPVKKGDFAMVPAGMLHACGKDMLVIEVGSFGGITYRLYDYGRGRKLDLEDSFQVLDPSLQCEIKHFGSLAPPSGGARCRPAIRHHAFCVDVVDVGGVWEEKKGNLYQILTAVEGEAVVKVDGESYPLPYTRTLLLPACIRRFAVEGRCRLLRSWREVPGAAK